MIDEKSVGSGEVRACRGEGILRASAIGSCVAVAAYDSGSGVGGMAHVMLPGSAPPGWAAFRRTKYAEHAVEEMMGAMSALGAREGAVWACLVGGANVLGAGHESPGPETTESLRGILGRLGIPVAAEDVGGGERRSCALDVAGGLVMYTVGDSEQRLLWPAETRSTGADGGGCGRQSGSGSEVTA